MDSPTNVASNEHTGWTTDSDSGNAEGDANWTIDLSAVPSKSANTPLQINIERLNLLPPNDMRWTDHVQVTLGSESFDPLRCTLMEGENIIEEGSGSEDDIIRIFNRLGIIDVKIGCKSLLTLDELQRITACPIHLKKAFIILKNFAKHILRKDHNFSPDLSILEKLKLFIHTIEDPDYVRYRLAENESDHLGYMLVRNFVFSNNDPYFHLKPIFPPREQYTQIAAILDQNNGYFVTGFCLSNVFYSGSPYDLSANLGEKLSSDSNTRRYLEEKNLLGVHTTIDTKILEITDLYPYHNTNFKKQVLCMIKQPHSIIEVHGRFTVSYISSPDSPLALQQDSNTKKYEMAAELELCTEQSSPELKAKRIYFV